MKGLEQTLAEQMQINDREIDLRMKLLNFSDADADVLRKHKPFVSKRIENIVEKFYDKQIQVPEIALLIGDIETLRRLQGAMRRYILELFDGMYGSEYVNRRLRIGKVHKRIGVSPKLYISAIWLLQKVLFDEIDEHVETECSANHSGLLKAALNKLLMLDTQFVFDTYISSLVSEVETAREELQNYADTLEQTVADRTQQLEEMSRRDSLTNLYNQHAFYEHLRRELSGAERYQEPITLAYFDLNGFKMLNDGEGHMVGDELLATIGAIMNEIFREIDYPCRYGGDEFAIILPRTRLEEAYEVCKRLSEAFSSHKTYGVTFSMGIVTTGPDEFEDSDSLVKRADDLMYLAKDKCKTHGGFQILEQKPVAKENLAEFPRKSR